MVTGWGKKKKKLICFGTHTTSFQARDCPVEVTRITLAAAKLARVFRVTASDLPHLMQLTRV